MTVLVGPALSGCVHLDLACALFNRLTARLETVRRISPATEEGTLGTRERASMRWGLGMGRRAEVEINL